MIGARSALVKNEAPGKAILVDSVTIKSKDASLGENVSRIDMRSPISSFFVRRVLSIAFNVLSLFIVFFRIYELCNSSYANLVI